MGQIPCTPIRIVGSQLLEGAPDLGFQSDMPVTFSSTDTGMYGQPQDGLGTYNSITPASGNEFSGGRVTYESVENFGPPVNNPDPVIDRDAFATFAAGTYDPKVYLPMGFQLSGGFIIG